jgi:site-specific DNA recombinase
METEIKNITKLVSIYARVSTGRQENEKTIETQLMAVNEFIKKNNYTFVQEYKDDGWSGDNLVRPDLDRLRVDANKKRWEAVVIYDPDRLARRGAWQEVVIEELKEKGIDVLFTTIPPPKNDEEMIMYKMRGVFTEYERMKIKERFRLGKIRKAREGHIVGNEPPYGYIYIPEKKNEHGDREHGYYVINETEANVVRMIFSWVANEKLTMRSVVRRLCELGIKPRESKKGTWNTSTLSTMLKRKTYIGEGHYLRSYAVIPENPFKKEIYKKIKKSSRKLRPETEWIKIPTPVIIDKELFEKASKIIKENYALCQRNRRNEYLLAGKIYCTCGRRRAGEGPQRGKHLYYRCTDRVYSFPLPRKCYEGGIEARSLDKLIWENIVKLMTSPELIEKEAEKWITNKNDVTKIVDISADQINKEIEKLKKEESRYVMAYGAEAISLDQLKERTAEIKERISSLRGQILYLDQQEKRLKEVSLPSRDYLKDLCQEAKNMLKCLNLGFEIKQKIIRELVDKVMGNQKEVSVEGYLPIDQNYYVEYKTINRNRRLAKCG